MAIMTRQALLKRGVFHKRDVGGKGFGQETNRILPAVRFVYDSVEVGARLAALPTMLYVDDSRL